jgi:hypothetical protein
MFSLKKSRSLKPSNDWWPRTFLGLKTRPSLTRLRLNNGKKSKKGVNLDIFGINMRELYLQFMVQNARIA